MKIIRLLALASTLCLVFAYLGCQRNIDEDLTLPPGFLGEKVQATVTGRVLDQQNIPVTGAQIKAGNHTVSTDLNGYFRINNATLNKNLGFIKVEKTGYFTGSRSFTTISGTNHYVTITLIKKEESGVFNSATGGDISVARGGAISFQAGSVIDPRTNSPYTGTVAVSAFLLDPTAENFFEIMPGTLRGIDDKQQEVGLESFGMMAVELTGAGGEKLQLSGGKPATIKFPIAPALQAKAPATIAFWSFNDTTGLWKQEGIATKQGNEYIGQASHFSFWNCDAPFPLIDFQATLTDQNGNKLKGQRVMIKVADADNGPAAPSTADTAGVIAGKVPAGRPLTLYVYGKCYNEILETKDIGPFTSSVNIGILVINQPPDVNITFTGEIQNCSGAPLQNGYVDIGIQGKHERASVVNGVLNYAFARCGNGAVKASIRITDTDNNIIGGILEYNITGNALDIGQQKVCEATLDQYLIYDIGNIHRQFLPPANPVYFYNFEGTGNLSYNEADTANSIYISFIGGAPNSSPEPRWMSLHINKVFYENAEPFTVQLEEYGGVGEYVSGTFSARMVEYGVPNAPQRPITGRFRIKRE